MDSPRLLWVQQRSSAYVGLRSAHPQITGSQQTSGDFRSVPIATLAPYSITSSAVERNSGEGVRPSARAVRRLTTKSNFDDALIGRSAGLAPRRMRST